jgi:GH15 family glucan-1,4-alpha-glucosidase
LSEVSGIGGRVDGFVPIREYAAIGDGRTVALLAGDGSIDWLPAPRIDSEPVFGALLDPERGGRFELAPADDYEVERRYVGRSNVLESTFTTETGEARVVDGLMLQDGGELSWIELLRHVVGVKGSVRFRFRLRPRFGFACSAAAAEPRGDAVVFACGKHALAFRAWEATVECSGQDAVGELEVRRGSASLLACLIATEEPIALPTRDEHELRLKRTVKAWERWVSATAYEGRYPEAVERSALALKLLISSKTGAVTAAATTSLPEKIGADRNWDYRFAWIRDTALTLDALGNLGFRAQVHASLSWLLRATTSTHPRLRPFYTLSGDVPRDCEDLDLAGYRGSRPVRKGNSASGQLQLGTYGDLLETIWLYVGHGNLLDEETGFRVAEIADHVCRVWQLPNSGFWELQEEQQYTESVLKCWVALDRAVRLAEAGTADPRNVDRWREQREAIRRWVDEHCWSERLQSYTFFPGTDQLDAAVLQAGLSGFLANGHPRLQPTIDAIRTGLSAGGPLLYRYSGQEGKEGAFVACSFWLVSALVTAGKVEEARELMDELLALSNDLGLFAEEIDAETGDFLGNIPQGLTHLALINAAIAIDRAKKEES